MNKTAMLVGFTTAFMLFSAAPSIRAADEMRAFPPAEAGMVRHVLQLPEQDDETIFKVELIAGKTVPVDADNRYFFGGTIEAKILEGWGYTYYLVSQLGPMAGTLMAIDPEAPLENRFIQLGGEPYLIRYNSRLPVVVYAPEEVQVRYRLWSTGQVANEMKEG